MAIYNGKIRTRYGEYTMSTKYKALVLLSQNVNVCKRVTDTYSSKGYIFMDCYSSLEDIRDGLTAHQSKMNNIIFGIPSVLEITESIDNSELLNLGVPYENLRLDLDKDNLAAGFKKYLELDPTAYNARGKIGVWE